MKKILKGKGGMTLIELVVAMLLFSMIVLAVTTVFVPMLKSYNNATEFAETNTLLDNIANELIGAIDKASTVSCSQNKVTITYNAINPANELEGGVTTYEVKDNAGQDLLYRDGILFLDRKYYRGKSLLVDFYTIKVDGSIDTAIIPTDNPKSFYVRISILKDANTFATRDYAVRPIGLN